MRSPSPSSTFCVTLHRCNTAQLSRQSLTQYWDFGIFNLTESAYMTKLSSLKYCQLEIFMDKRRKCRIQMHLTQFNPHFACENKSLGFITVKNKFLCVSLLWVGWVKNPLKPNQHSQHWPCFNHTHKHRQERALNFQSMSQWKHLRSC